MERTIEQELKPMGRPEHECRICKGRFSCGQELDEHMQSHRLNNGEATTCEPLCISEFFTSNSNSERGGCSSVVGAAGSGEPVDGNPHPPPQLHAEDEDAVHCLLVLSNSGSECAPVPNQNLSATPAGHECDNCNMVFPSHQALGGHRASHKSVEGCFVASLKNRSADANNKRIENPNNNVDIQNNMASPWPENMALPIVPLAEYSLQYRLPPRKDPKPHICKICQQQFPTGQALGGHMRCHRLALNITATAATTIATAASVNLTTTAATTKAANATTFAPDAQIEASSNEVNETKLCRPTLPLLFKSPHLNIDQNMPAEPTYDMDRSSLQLCLFNVKSPQHGWEMEPKRKQDLGDIAAEPTNDMNGSLLHLCFPDVKSPQHGWESEPKRKKDLGDQATEPINAMNGSSLQLCFSDVKSLQHGQEREPKRKKDLSDLRNSDDEDGKTPWLRLGIGSKSDEEGEHDNEGH